MSHFYAILRTCAAIIAASITSCSTTVARKHRGDGCLKEPPQRHEILSRSVDNGTEIRGDSDGCLVQEK